MARHHGPRGSPCSGHVIAQVVLEQLGVPAHGRAVAGDVAGIAFNARAVTVAAQIAAAEAFP